MMGAHDPYLVFVYNANRGFFEALKEGVTKFALPSTYTCRLCALTYGRATMRPRWRRFVEGLGVRVEFLHRDEFREPYGESEAGYPAAYVERGGELEPFISSDEMNATETLDDLMETVRERLDERGLQQGE
jgi:hypothetical protein